MKSLKLFSLALLVVLLVLPAFGQPALSAPGLPLAFTPGASPGARTKGATPKATLVATAQATAEATAPWTSPPRASPAVVVVVEPPEIAAPVVVAPVVESGLSAQQLFNLVLVLIAALVALSTTGVAGLIMVLRQNKAMLVMLYQSADPATQKLLRGIAVAVEEIGDVAEEVTRTQGTFTIKPANEARIVTGLTEPAG